MTRCNLKTVQDRCIVSIKVQMKIVCAVSNGYVGDDLGWPPNPLKHSNFYILHCLSYPTDQAQSLLLSMNALLWLVGGWAGSRRRSFSDNWHWWVYITVVGRRRSRSCWSSQTRRCQPRRPPSHRHFVSPAHGPRQIQPCGTSRPSAVSLSSCLLTTAFNIAHLSVCINFYVHHTASTLHSCLCLSVCLSLCMSVSVCSCLSEPLYVSV